MHIYKNIKYLYPRISTSLIRLILSVRCSCRRRARCLRRSCHAGRGAGHGIRRAVDMVRIAWKIGIEIQTQPDAHADTTHWMRMVMEHMWS